MIDTYKHVYPSCLVVRASPLTHRLKWQFIPRPTLHHYRHKQNRAPCSAFELMLPAVPQPRLSFRKCLCRYICLLENLNSLLTKIVLGKDVDYRGHTECFKFPTHEHRVQRVTALYDGEQKHWRLCRYGPCPACRQSPCAFVVHSDCIKIFQTRMPKIRFSQIWHLGLWLNPIPGARYYVSEYNTPRFSVEGDTTYPETKEFRSWLRGVNTLPQEIINVVLANSETPLISRFAFVLGWQPENLRKLEAQAAKSILPQAISSWFREHFGQEAPLHPRFFVIGLGSLGIRSFQLLESRPTISSTQFLGCSWYIVDKLNRLDDYIIRTNVGTLT